MELFIVRKFSIKNTKNIAHLFAHRLLSSRDCKLAHKIDSSPFEVGCFSSLMSIDEMSLIAGN
jgi:hypothetical protein